MYLIAGGNSNEAWRRDARSALIKPPPGDYARLWKTADFFSAAAATGPQRNRRANDSLSLSLTLPLFGSEKHAPAHNGTQIEKMFTCVYIYIYFVYRRCMCVPYTREERGLRREANGTRTGRERERESDEPMYIREKME